jgi:hypothetical protein
MQCLKELGWVCGFALSHSSSHDPLAMLLSYEVDYFGSSYMLRMHCADATWSKECGALLQIQCAFTELERLKSIFPEEQSSKTLQPLEQKLRDLLKAKRNGSHRENSTLPTGSLVGYDSSAPGSSFHSAPPLFVKGGFQQYFGKLKVLGLRQKKTDEMLRLKPNLNGVDCVD